MPPIGKHEPPRCGACGKIKPDVKYDPGTRRALCNECWANTSPIYGPGPSDRRP
jgi:recombinational DNA repair protein (RecF pathway)